MARLNKILCVYFIIIAILIYLPIIHVIVFSFKTGAGISYPLERLTLDWYIGPTKMGWFGGFINDKMIVSSLWNSLYIAIVVMIITTLLVTMTALALRREFRGRDFIFYVTLLGFIIPGVSLGLCNLVLFQLLKIPLSMWTCVFVQVVYAVPFGLILMLARFEPRLARYEEAARLHRASEWQVFKNVTFPLIRPQVLSAALFGFVLSLGEVVRSFFVAPHGSPTLPVLIYSQLTSQPPSPKYYALGTVVSIVSIVLLFISAILLTWKRQ